MILIRPTLLPILLAGALVAGHTFSGCSESKSVLKQVPTEERFNEAMADLENEDYLDAQEKFNVIILQDPGSALADDAQYYLGESYFRNDDYRMAAFHFNRLRSSFPNSQFYKMALYRSAQAYELSAPGFERDQTDTRTAINVYQSFINLYRGDTLATQAQERIGSLRSKLAHKEFSIAEQYMKLDEFESAVIYYDRVIELYPDTPYALRSASARTRALELLAEEQNERDKDEQTEATSPAVSPTGRTENFQRETPEKP